MKVTDFADKLTEFLSVYLPNQKNVSSNTIKSYRDVFTLFLRYSRDQKGLCPEKLTLELVDVTLIFEFLEHLEIQRKCGIRTRNHRLSVLHAFFRFLQVEEPSRIAQCQRILAIPLKRFSKNPVNYLSKENMKQLFRQPDIQSMEGKRDLTLLKVLYDTGARVQELIDITLGDLHLDSPAQVRLKGKGRKIRIVPLLNSTVQTITEYIKEQRLNLKDSLDYPLFFNKRKEPLSRSGVKYILKKYVRNMTVNTPGMIQSVSPHTLRHSKAMHLLQAGNPATTIQAILGHADLKTTTEIYAKADIEMKRKALEKAENPSDEKKMPFWQEDRNLMSWLAGL